MKKSLTIYLITLSMGLFVLSSCNKDNEDEDGLARVLITFDPRYEGSSIQIADRFYETHNYPVEFTSIKFYLSQLELITGSQSVALSDIEIISVEENRIGLEYEIPAGTYSGIKFNLGVPQEMNGIEASNPDFMLSIFDSGHPLNVDEGMYWGWNTGYRFFSFEGKCDTTNVDTEPISIPFTFHSGTDTLFRELPAFNHTFTASRNQTKVIPFEIDLGALFASESDTIDLRNERAYHGHFNQLPVGMKFANNSAASIKLIE